jgi:two-component system, sensor histidine kinase and response regulator
MAVSELSGEVSVVGDRPCAVDGASFAEFPDAFLELDCDGRITGWNAQAEATFGWPRWEAAGQTFSQLAVSPDDRTEFTRALRGFFDPEVKPRLRRRRDVVALHREGREVAVELTLFSTLCGQAGRLGIFARDISQRRQVEQEAEKGIHTLMNQLGEEYYELDLRGNYKFANTTFAQYYGVRTSSEIVGRNFKDLFGPEEIAAFVENYSKVYRTGERVRQEYTVVVGGRLVYVEDTVSLKRNSNGTPVGFMVLSRDVSERKLDQIELARAKEAAESANRTKSEFLANMSHEIRTPMNGVLGATELVLDTELTPDQRELVETAKVSAEGLLVVINDILDFSKIEAGKLELDPVAFSLREVVERAMRAHSVAGARKGLKLHSSVDPGIPEKIVSDPNRLAQILTNLLGNAIKFTLAGEVELRVELKGLTSERVQLHFSVRDSGIGIPRSKQESIFEAFSQADTSTTRNFGGTGLGLTISSKLVQMLGGDLGVESEVGTGSRFHFTLCMRLAGTETSEVPATIAGDFVPETPAGLRILLAEDNVVNQKLAVRLLEKQGHLVAVAGTGTKVLELLRSQSFDLILMDVQMPEMDGFETTAAIRESEKGTGKRMPIVALTAHAMVGDRERCFAAGMDAYTTKPIRTEELNEKVRRLHIGTAAPRPADARHDPPDRSH